MRENTQLILPHSRIPVSPTVTSQYAMQEKQTSKHQKLKPTTDKTSITPEKKIKKIEADHKMSYNEAIPRTLSSVQTFALIGKTGAEANI